MERKPLVKVKNWVKIRINPKSFDVQKFRDLLLNNVISSTIGEICAYRLLFQDVKGGELPSYVPELDFFKIVSFIALLAFLVRLIRRQPDRYLSQAEVALCLSIAFITLLYINILKIFNINSRENDTLIVAMSALEAIVAPFVSWLGFKRRRFVLVTYTLVVLLSTVSLFLLPSATIRQKSEFCDAVNPNNDISYQGMSGRSIARLTIIIMATLAFQMCRVITWTHGLAYCDEYAPERISVHYGALLLGRVVVLVIGNRLITGLVDNLLPVQIALLLFSYVYNLIQLLCVVPKNAPKVKGVQKTSLPLDDRGFTVTVSRVVSRSLVSAVALAASLLAAALWGIGYNREYIIRVKFLTPSSSPLSVDLLLRHMYIVMPIALAGVKFSVPVLLEYCKKKALKQTAVMTVFAFIFFILLTILPQCDQGSVAGLEDNSYNYPECSLSCGCKPRWDEFNPVCVTDNMTTFLSPCHAGCSGTESINGIQVYTGCRCAGAGGALPGACATDCKQQYILHDMLFIVATTFTLLALQAQGVLVLKVVDPRDKSVAMGLLLAMVTLMTFVCGHMMFTAIRVTTCRWYEGGQCHLQNTKFPYIVGFCSSFLVLLSAVISIATIVITRRYDNNISRLRSP